MTADDRGAPTSYRPVRRFPPLWLSAFWVAGLLTVFTFANDALAAVPAFTVERALCLFLGAAALARAITERESLPRPGRVEASAVVFLGVIVLSWLRTWPGKEGETLRMDLVLLFEGFVMPFAAYWFGRMAAHDGAPVERVIWALVGFSGLYLGLAGWLEWAAQVLWFEPRTFDITHPERTGGPFTSSVTYGMSCAALAFFILALRPRLRARWRGVAAALVAGGILLGAAISAARGVWLGTCVGLVWLMTRQKAMWRNQLVVAAIAILIGALGLVAHDRTSPTTALATTPATASAPTPGVALETAPMPTATASVAASSDAPPPVVVPLPRPTPRPAHSVVPFAERLMEASPIQARIGAWAVALSMIRDRPLLGFGWASDTFSRLKPLYKPISSRIPPEWAAWPTVPHNDILWILITCGLVGLGAMTVFLARLARQILDLGRSADELDRALAAALGATLLMIVANGQFADLMYFWQPQVLFLFLLGLSCERKPAATAE